MIRTHAKQHITASFRLFLSLSLISNLYIRRPLATFICSSFPAERIVSQEELATRSACPHDIHAECVVISFDDEWQEELEETDDSDDPTHKVARVQYM